MQLKHKIDQNEITRVLVYGTLKSGEYNHEPYLGDKLPIARCALPGHVMLSLGSFPACIRLKMPVQEASVQCELYEVSYADLDDLDTLEGHPNWYKRDLVTLPGHVKRVDGSPLGGSQQAWIYRMEEEVIKDDSEYIPSGVWSKHAVHRPWKDSYHQKRVKGESFGTNVVAVIGSHRRVLPWDQDHGIATGAAAEIVKPPKLEIGPGVEFV